MEEREDMIDRGPADASDPQDLERFGRFRSRTNLIPARERLLPRGQAARGILTRRLESSSSYPGLAPKVGSDMDTTVLPVPGPHSPSHKLGGG